MKQHWPAVAAECAANGLGDRATMIAVVATIGTEVGSFAPINEFGGPSYFKRYDGQEGSRQHRAR